MIKAGSNLFATLIAPAFLTRSMASNMLLRLNVTTILEFFQLLKILIQKKTTILLRLLAFMELQQHLELNFWQLKRLLMRDLLAESTRLCFLSMEPGLTK